MKYSGISVSWWTFSVDLLDFSSYVGENKQKL